MPYLRCVIGASAAAEAEWYDAVVWGCVVGVAGRIGADRSGAEERQADE
jgi:hypothetical protein